jgi:hypothetical protein
MHFAFQQPHPAGAAVTFAALKLHAEIVGFQQRQQIGMFVCAFQPGAGTAQNNNVAAHN